MKAETAYRLKGTCVPPGMETACPRHARAVLHKQAPVCVACPRMERQFSGMDKIIMADPRAVSAQKRGHGGPQAGTSKLG